MAELYTDVNKITADLQLKAFYFLQNIIIFIMTGN